MQFRNPRRIAGVALALLIAGSAAPPAAPVRAASSPPGAATSSDPSATVGTVDLGSYAVNGSVTSVVAEAGTGRTYITGDFTQVGVRTGPVALVDPPEAGDGALRPVSPEVVGRVDGVVANDRAGDPGFLLLGEVSAIRGVAVPHVSIVRLHLNTAGTAWVHDSTWALHSPCEMPSELFTNTWTDGGDWLALGSRIWSYGGTGAWLVRKSDGLVSGVGATCRDGFWRQQPILPDLAACDGLGWSYCYGVTLAIHWDAARARLLVAGSDFAAKDSNPDWKGWIASYDPASLSSPPEWLTPLQPADPGTKGIPTKIATTGDRILLWGGFNPEGVESGISSRLFALDATTGMVTQRWNDEGEQDLADGSVSGAANRCLTDQPPATPVTTLHGATAAWVGIADSVLCTYATASGEVVGTPSAFTATPAAGETLPYALYEADGTTYLLGQDSAIDTTTGAAVDWHPGPARSTGPAVSIAASGAGVLLAGAFPFLRGSPANGLAAFDADRAPDLAFAASTAAVGRHGGMIALDQGTLVVPTRDGVAFVDPLTGQVTGTSTPVPNLDMASAVAVNPANGEIWVARRAYLPGDAALHRFASPASGGAELPAPAIGCLATDLPGLPCDPVTGYGTWVQALRFDTEGRLYLGGLFGQVDGQPRRGLARLAADGPVDGWQADLVAGIAAGWAGTLGEVQVRTLLPLGERLLVGGSFSWAPTGGEAGFQSPIEVFSVTTGAHLMPTSMAPGSTGGWFAVAKAYTAYDLLPTSSGIHVALGGGGIAVLDATTLAYDHTVVGTTNPNTWSWSQWGSSVDDGVYAFAAPVDGAPPVPAVASSTSLAAVRRPRAPSPWPARSPVGPTARPAMSCGRQRLRTSHARPPRDRSSA